MSKNIGITFYFTGKKDVVGDRVLRRIEGMTLYDELNSSLKEFFVHIADMCDGDMFAATVRQERVLEELKISRATYYNRLNKLSDLGLLRKSGKGYYEVNRRFAHIVTDADKKLEEAMRKFKL